MAAPALASGGAAAAAAREVAIRALRARVDALRLQGQGELSLSPAFAFPASAFQPGTGYGQQPLPATAWEKGLAALDARPPSARAAEHFASVLEAGADANRVVFPHKALREPPPSAFLAPLGEAAVDRNTLPFPLRGCDGIKSGSDADEESMDGPHAKYTLWRRGLARGPQELRSAMHEDASALDTAVGDAGAPEGQAVAWSVLEEDVVVRDVCTPSQLRVLALRAARGPISMERRREALARKLARGGEAAAPPPPGFFEEVRPTLGREAALAEMRARWAIDRARAAREHDAAAEAGAALVAWPAEGERRWPKPPASWTRHCLWFARWRKSRAEARGCSASEAASESSWEVVSVRSDSSWQRVEATAEVDPQLQLERAVADLEASRAALDCLCSNDLQELKSLLKPPHGVGLVAEALSVCFGFPTGRWGNDRKVWAKPMECYAGYDIDNIPPKVLQKLGRFVEDPQFDPEAVRRCSIAAASFCHWIHALVAYGRAANAKRQAEEALKPTATSESPATTVPTSPQSSRGLPPTP